LAQSWGSPEDILFVIGATRSDFLQKVREIAPDNFFLVPGVGAQGGSLADVAKYAMNSRIGLLVNSSRGIIYAGDNPAMDAKREARKIQEEMATYLDEYYIK
jgi:orotidine-5'-phosphate decarboxylase